MEVGREMRNMDGFLSRGMCTLVQCIQLVVGHFLDVFKHCKLQGRFTKAPMLRKIFRGRRTFA